MGAKLLNKFLKDKCRSSTSIYNIHISKLSHKIIAVDISIYLYKYESENALIENIYTMISIFRYYNIIPIFIFDGAAPTEKKELIAQRLQNKRRAEYEYNKLKVLLDTSSENEKIELIEQMSTLKKKFVYMNINKINKIKLLLNYGMTYIDAPGEADQLCAMLVIQKKAWACLSDDTDMFVYGCNRVLRYFSILNHKVVMYDYDNILKELDIDHANFKEICVLSGTDYNNNIVNSYNIFKLMQFYETYKSTEKKEPFVAWLCKTSSDIEIDFDLLIKIINMFDITKLDMSGLDGLSELDGTIYTGVANKKIERGELYNLLKEEGFLF